MDEKMFSISFQFNTITEADDFLSDFKRYQQWKDKKQNKPKREASHIVELHKRAKEIKIRDNISYKEALKLAGKDKKE